LVFGQFNFSVSSRMMYVTPYPGNTWTNLAVSLRIPAAGAYRFRTLGLLFRYNNAGGVGTGALRIYVNGVNSSAADIVFAKVSAYDGRTYVFINVDRDLTGLAKGDKIELYYQYDSPHDGRETAYEFMSFTVLIAGENCHGIHALADYSLATDSLSMIQPTTSIYVAPLPPPPPPVQIY